MFFNPFLTLAMALCYAHEGHITLALLHLALAAAKLHEDLRP